MAFNRMSFATDYIRLTDDTKAGFKKHTNTMDQAVAFTQQVKKAIHLKMPTLAVLVAVKPVSI